MMVKNTCRNRLTALINTATRYNHASPDIVWRCDQGRLGQARKEENARLGQWRWLSGNVLANEDLDHE
jgi:hypothetical protein